MNASGVDGDHAAADLIELDGFEQGLEIAVGKALIALALDDFEEDRAERILGEDPASGKPVSVKIGRFGPVLQIGTADDEDKPRFAQMKKGLSLETITLEEALESFKLPRILGDYEGTEVKIGIGRFGPYVYHNKAYVAIPKGIDPMEITMDEAEELILEKRKKEAEKHIKTFAEEPDLEILNGRYGPYMKYKDSNYRIPKDIVPQDLSLESCIDRKSVV